MYSETVVTSSWPGEMARLKRSFWLFHSSEVSTDPDWAMRVTPPGCSS